MESAEQYLIWDKDAHLLRKIGKRLSAQPTRIQVRLSRELADEAVEIWHRDDVRGDVTSETPEQKHVRRLAAAMAMIGQSIEESGVEDGHDVVCSLDAWEVGTALEAANEVGFFNP